MFQSVPWQNWFLDSAVRICSQDVHAYTTYAEKKIYPDEWLRLDGRLACAEAQKNETFLIQREPGNIRWTDENAISNIMLKDTLMVVNNKPFLLIKILKTFLSSTCFTD